MIIGLVGFKNSGKDTVARIISEQYEYKIESFAKPVKDITSILFNWDRKLLEGDTEESRNWREKSDWYWSKLMNRSFSPREALQMIGTECMRNVVHNDIWVFALMHRCHLKNVIVTDVRFKNEIDAIRNNGGRIIQIQRGELPEWFSDLKKIKKDNDRKEYMEKFGIHQSEWDWVGSNIDHIITNDSDLDDLKNSVLHTMEYITR